MIVSTGAFLGFTIYHVLHLLKKFKIVGFFHIYSFKVIFHTLQGIRKIYYIVKIVVKLFSIIQYNLLNLMKTFVGP